MRRALLLGAFAALASAAAAHADTIALISPIAYSTPPPPLFATSTLEGGTVEFRLPGRVSARELVQAGLEDDGSVRAVVVTQRLVLTGTGDYSFLIPVAATSVGPTPDSQSQPGLRNLGIVWQGFSSKRRLLAARATLA